MKKNLLTVGTTAILALIFTAFFATSAFAVPTVDGFYTPGEYGTNSFETGWYNGHKLDETGNYNKADDYKTTGYYEDIVETVDGQSVVTGFYLYVAAPTYAKGMLWTGSEYAGTAADAAFYGEAASKLDFEHMTGSEKLQFPGMEANLAGPLHTKKDGKADPKPEYTGTLSSSVTDYADSVDYVINILSICNTNGCGENDIPMAFEIQFDATAGTSGALISAIQSAELSFHLSPWGLGDIPDNGKPPVVPEPATFVLFGVGIVGLIAYRKKSKK